MNQFVGNRPPSAAVKRVCAVTEKARIAPNHGEIIPLGHQKLLHPKSPADGHQVLDLIRKPLSLVRRAAHRERSRLDEHQVGAHRRGNRDSPVIPVKVRAKWIGKLRGPERGCQVG